MYFIVMFKLSTTCYLQSQELLNGLISGGGKIILVKIIKNEQFCTNMHFHDRFANLNYAATFC